MIQPSMLADSTVYDNPNPLGASNSLQPPPSRLLPELWWRKPISQLACLAPIESIAHPELNALGVNLSIKREDLLCQYLGGNKLYKLHYHLQRAFALRAHTIATFGGAYSNHIYALARVGYELGVKTIGVIRGERPELLSPTLHDALAMGMELKFVDRGAYKLKNSAQQQIAWMLNAGGVYVVPEGGGDLRGALGMAEYWRNVQLSLTASNHRVDAVVIAAGTGASLAGIMAASQGIAVHGVLALKGSTRMTSNFANHTVNIAHRLRRGFEAVNMDASGTYSAPMCWQLHTDNHGGGYGPAKGDLSQHIKAIECEMAVPLDPVYTGKMMAAIVAIARQGGWNGKHILAIHSGGLQGRRSLGL